MIFEDKIIEVFCELDDFNKEYQTVITKNSLCTGSNPKKRNRKFRMSDSEVMTILILFHFKSYRNLKHFYINHVCKYEKLIS